MKLLKLFFAVFLLLLVSCTNCSKEQFIILPTSPTSLRLNTSTGETHMFMDGAWVPIVEISQEEWVAIQKELRRQQFRLR